MKYKWRVNPVPEGRYRSFEKRAWPEAVYEGSGELICACIACDDAYVPRNIKSALHAQLTLRIADYSVKPWAWRRTKNTFATLAGAKQGLIYVLEKHPEFIPKELNN